MNRAEILGVLYELALGADPDYKEEARRKLRETQPYYDRLCQALGEEEGDKLWSAMVEIGAAAQDGAFRSGLSMGLRLMALCV